MGTITVVACTKWISGIPFSDCEISSTTCVVPTTDMIIHDGCNCHKVDWLVARKAWLIKRIAEIEAL